MDADGILFKARKFGGHTAFRQLAAFVGTFPRHVYFLPDQSEDNMSALWDTAFLQDQIRQFQDLAKRAMHPDVKAAYQSYVKHYETLLNSLRARHGRGLATEG